MALSVNVLSEARSLLTPSGRTVFVLEGRWGFDLGALVAACYDAKCRPPTSGGTGGSLPGRVVGRPLSAGDIAEMDFREGLSLKDFFGRSLPGKSQAAIRRVIDGDDATASDGSWIEDYSAEDRKAAKMAAQVAVAEKMLKDPEYVAWAEKVLMTPVAYPATALQRHLDKLGLLLPVVDFEPFIGKPLDDILYSHHQLSGGKWDDPVAGFTSALAAGLIDQWAESSGDNHPYSIAMQLAAASVHGMSKESILGSGTSKGMFDEGKYIFGGMKVPFEAFVRAEYEATQEFFRDAGVTEVVLYRGMHLRKGEGDTDSLAFGDEVPLRSNPMSSWATDAFVAATFASTTFSNRGVRGVMFAMRVPVSAIQSSPVTGRGCLTEHEFTVLDGQSDATVLWVS